MIVRGLSKLAITLYISIIAVLMNSCATTSYVKDGTGYLYSVDINSFGNYNLKGKTYYIESGDENISSNDLEFKEYAEYLKKDLKIQGAKETSDIENADMCILMNYYITDKSYQESIPIPQYGRTTVASTTTKGSTTTYNYNYGTTGYYYVQNNVSKYLRIVNVYAYDNKTLDSEPIMLWKTNLKSEGSRSDLRTVIPFIMFAGSGEFGKSTNGEKQIIVWEEGYLFNCWKNGMFNDPNIVLYPKVTKSMLSNNFKICYVEKRNNETIVCLEKSGYIDSYYGIFPETYIKIGSKETKISHVENYSLGNLIFDESGTRYFILHFPIELKPGYNSFEIYRYANKKHTRWVYWGTVELKK